MVQKRKTGTPWGWQPSTGPQRNTKEPRGGPEKAPSATDYDYGNLLSETVTDADGESRPVKRRKTATTRGKLSTSYETDEGRHATSTTSPNPDESTPEEEEDEDEFVDVDLSAADGALAKGISVVISGPSAEKKKAQKTNKLSGSMVERQKRIESHKLHILCLIAHAYHRNAWCNDAKIQSNLANLYDDKVKAFLLPPTSRSQFERSQSFLRGLDMAMKAFRPSFTITARGITHPQWMADPTKPNAVERPGKFDPALNKEAFIKLSARKEGSRDIGAQLFCAMLRSIGIPARLVCSLQTLSLAYTPTVAKPAKVRKHQKIISGGEVIYDSTSDKDAQSSSPAPRISDSEFPAGPSRMGRLGNYNSLVPNSDAGRSIALSTTLNKFNESTCPVYWVEALDSAYQRWIPVDPMVTMSVKKPNWMEPPSSDQRNNMSYVLAFNKDGSVKDVTRRYVKAYNAKTRRSRIESIQDGGRWWMMVLKLFEGELNDLDQIENAELAKREEAEPMPKDAASMKDHPYYVLERHLKRNEIIHPQNQVVGKIKIGSRSNALETVYRRAAVKVVTSARTWYRDHGCLVKAGQQPLKYGTKRSTLQRRRSSTLVTDDQEKDDQTEALYAEEQTELYIPPAVQDGQIPKNNFGNLDIYLPTMIPPGAAHVRAAETAKAAAIIGVDYSDAVIGFDYKRKSATVKMNGAIVAVEHVEAVIEVIGGLRWQKELAMKNKQSAEALRLWKKFMIGLRIRERIMAGVDQQDIVEEDGGFLPEQDQAIAQPTAGSAPNEPIPTTEATDFADDEMAVNSRKTAQEAFYDALYEANMIVYSPWDYPGRLWNHPLAKARRGHAKKGTKASQAGGFLIDSDADDEEEEKPNGRDKRKRVQRSASIAVAASTPNELSEYQSFGEEEEVSGFEDLFEEGDSSLAARLAGENDAGEGAVIAQEGVGEVRGGAVDAQEGVEDAEEEVVATGGDDDKSLLSEDPEDVDAEPEWIQ